MTTTRKIVGRLEGRLIPAEVNLEGEMPPGYKEMLREAYRQKMRRRAHRILQTMPPSNRTAILNFLMNEDEIRDAKTFLENHDYDEEVVAEVNAMARTLLGDRDTILNRAHDSLLDSNELMQVFVGGASEARVSLESDNPPYE